MNTPCINATLEIGIQDPGPVLRASPTRITAVIRWQRTFLFPLLHLDASMNGSQLVSQLEHLLKLVYAILEPFPQVRASHVNIQDVIGIIKPHVIVARYITTIARGMGGRLANGKIRHIRPLSCRSHGSKEPQIQLSWDVDEVWVVPKTIN